MWDFDVREFLKRILFNSSLFPGIVSYNNYILYANFCEKLITLTYWDLEELRRETDRYTELNLMKHLTIRRRENSERGYQVIKGLSL